MGCPRARLVAQNASGDVRVLCKLTDEALGVSSPTPASSAWRSGGIRNFSVAGDARRRKEPDAIVSRSRRADWRRVQRTGGAKKRPKLETKLRVSGAGRRSQREI